MSSLLKRLSKLKQDKVYSLKDYVEKSLPCSVKFKRIIAAELKKDLEDLFVHDETLSVEKFITIDFVKLRVLNDPDRDDTPLGRVRAKYVGQELLVPLEYPGLIVPRNRTISRKVFYNCVSQIVDNDVKFFTTEQNTFSIDLKNKGGALPLRAGSKMAVKNTFRLDKQDYIGCTTSKGDGIYFHLCHPLKFSAFPPHVSQTLKHIASHVLPKIVTFGQITRRHLAPMTDTDIARLSTIVNGPLKLLEVVSKHFVVLRVRKDGSLMLLPECLHSCVTVVNEKRDPEHHFASFMWSESFESSLYMVEDSDIKPIIFPPAKGKSSEDVHPYDTVTLTDMFFAGLETDTSNASFDDYVLSDKAYENDPDVYKALYEDDNDDDQTGIYNTIDEIEEAKNDPTW